MPTIKVESQLQYDVRQPTNMLFKIAAAQTDRQQVRNTQLTIDPEITIETLEVGLEGNTMQRVSVQPCQLTLHYEAEVDAVAQPTDPGNIPQTNVGNLPTEVLPYLNPSRYCESDLLGRFAFEEFGQMQPGLLRVQAICDWVNEHLDYTPGSTGVTTTAADVVLQRTGVCRDYAHLAIALCRGIGVPARYVSGYAAELQPPDFHGFMEAYLGDQWYFFDPTKLASVGGLVRIATGRDAADVAFATITGDAGLTSKMVSAVFL
ncbi:Transglutaminase-like superfamily protein [Stieleria maiorica]|uniref:Transglutaminase-like superfamily protein n=1 Tax=Stieleria maiorica TaxID=2795974 RepID=A0A5B9MAD0_9BACT|nr:transglutaminase family protein [Stieleria maiorica]QEF98241.1 Transglutaminase-like superfamily protein [Stieleria maiorica]